MTEPAYDIRIATAADIPQVERIVADAYLPWLEVIGTRPGPLDSDYVHLVDTGSVYVTGDPELIGLVVFSPGPDTILIENVAVDRDRQGEGIGHGLIAFAEAAARDQGISMTRLFTHEKMVKNIRLYKTLGYTVTGREAILGGYLVHMRKALVAWTGSDKSVG